jgi:hypothetical protein
MVANFGLIAFRDPNGIRPLVIGKTSTEYGDEYIVASESVALDVLGYELVRDVAPGEAIFIDMNGNFYSNMDQFIMDNPQIQLWIHGHMHDPFDYGIGGTRVVCNPRGYIQYEQRAQEFELQVIELL